MALVLRHALFIIAIYSITPSISLSQSEDVLPKPGSWALQFSVGSNLTLSSFQGSMLSIKKQIGPSNGWRVGIGIDGKISTFESIRRNTSTDTTTSSFNQENDDLRLQVIVEYISYLDTKSDIKPYFAVGPRFALESVDNVTPEGLFPTARQSYEDGSYSIGLSAEFGVEWFFAESMSLMAEYGLFVGYSKFTRTETATFPDPSQNWTETREAESFDIEDSGGRLGISVYF